MELEERIAYVMSDYCTPVEYSSLRDKFKKDKDFLDRFCFLISTGDIRVLNNSHNMSKYPGEVSRIRTIQKQYESAQGASTVSSTMTVYDGLPESSEEGLDAFVFYNPNTSKLRLP